MKKDSKYFVVTHPDISSKKQIVDDMMKAA
jgi:hypothetical protein